MDRELEQLEAELKRLQPVAPSDGLMRRVAAKLDQSEPVRRDRSWWLWAAVLPAAAALAITITGVTSRPDTTAPRAPGDKMVDDQILKPVMAENVLYATVDEGVLTLADGTPVRRERLSFVDTFTWKNPRTNASLKWSVPREEVRVVPVSYQ